jgi:hypothetical protein
MIALTIIGFLFLFIVKLAVVEGVVLGVVWLINTLVDTSISYGLVGGIVAGLMALLLIGQLALFGSAYRTMKEDEARFDSWYEETKRKHGI